MSRRTATPTRPAPLPPVPAGPAAYYQVCEAQARLSAALLELDGLTGSTGSVYNTLAAAHRVESAIRSARRHLASIVEADQ